MATTNKALHSARVIGQGDRFFDAAARVMERTLRILTGSSELTVEVSNTYNFPAWANLATKEICFNKFNVDADPNGQPDYVEATATIKGLLYHEVSHLLWTPTLTSGNAARTYYDPSIMGEATFFMLFNAMEDKRIENLFVRKYKPAAAYFARPVHKFILNQCDELNPNSVMTYFLVSGRYYLGGKLIDPIRKAATHEGLSTDKLDELVNRYLALSTSDIERRPSVVKGILEELLKLLQDSGRYGQTPTCSSGEGKDSSEATIKSNTRAKGHNPKPMDPDNSMEPSEIEDLQKSQQEEAEASGEEPGESSEEGGSESDQSGSSGNAETEASLKDLMESAMEEAERELDQNQSAIEEDASKTNQSIQHASRGASAASSRTFESTDAAVESDMRTASARIQRDLNAVRNEGAPETHRNQIAGRLNQRRIVAHPEAFDPFDVFDIGTEDDMRIHVQIGIDLSDSMQGPPIHEASRASWILRDAFDRCDHDADLYVYAHSYQFVDRRHNRSLFPLWKPDGGTSPSAMLSEMLYRASTRTDPDKLIIVVTDGLWFGDVTKYESILDGIRAIGGTSMLIVLGDEDVMRERMKSLTSETNPYGFDYVEYGAGMLATVPAIQQLVKQLMKAHLSR